MRRLKPNANVVERVLFNHEVGPQEYEAMRARMSRFDMWRFRRAMRSLTRIARKIDLGPE